MILGLSSRIAGGKDTVASMIQRIAKMQLVEAGAISANAIPTLKEIASGVSVHGSGWEVKKYAGKLKQIASMLTGISVEKFEDQEFKKTLLGDEWDNMSVRLFLQKLGTEAVRDGLHSNTWVNGLFADYKPKRKKGEDEEYESTLPKWIITDVRFPNEFQGVKERGGIMVRITRGQQLMNDPFLHPSETSLDNHYVNRKFDWVIDNNGTLEELEMQVAKMLTHFKLI